MSLAETLAFVLDPSRILVAQGWTADPWQRDLLLTPEQFVLLNCSRQAGKSTAVAALALHQALVFDGSLILLVAPVERQSRELFRKVLDAYLALDRPIRARRQNESTLELVNGSRIVALPGREATIRSFSGVALLILDEAARVPDDLYRAVRPMLAVSQGRLFALSTPCGQRGWFHEEWIGKGPWKRVLVPWHDCPRIRPAFVDDERRALGDDWVRQEYECLFTAMEGLVYPDFALACVPEQPAPEGKKVGGIDFGWRNPFAAVWGVLDRDDVLWLVGERYLTETPLAEHAQALPKGYLWFADPAGRADIEELIRRNHTVVGADNSIRRGVAMVTARIRTGRLKVLPACRHLIAEAQLYRYPSERDRAMMDENPVDANNHALAALRYMIAELDARPRATPRSQT